MSKLEEILVSLKLGELFGSKKFKVMLSTVFFIAITSLIQFGVITQDAVNQIFATVGIYLGVQGLADYGKAKNGNTGPMLPDLVVRD